MDEFKQFLPDTSAEPAPGSSAALGQIAAGGGANRPGIKRPAAPTKKDEGSAKKAKPVRAKPEEKGKVSCLYSEPSWIKY